MRTYANHRRAESGFTLVELLVVIAIIGMLVALLVPAVNSARARGRQATCLNNIRQIATAVISYESAKGAFPGYVKPLKAVGANGVEFVQWLPGAAGQEFVESTFQPASQASQSNVAWSAHILPEMDNQALYDTLVSGSGAISANQRVLKGIESFVCPDDTDVLSVPGAAGLTYVANAGTWDWDGGYIGDTKENGLFQNLVFGNVKTRMSAIRDGAANTLMLSENRHKTTRMSWFGVPTGEFGEQQLGMVWVINTRPNPAGPDGSCASDTDQQLISNDGGLPRGSVTWPADSSCYARPASGHPRGACNVAYADGHAGALAADIQYDVYLRLMSPHGAKVVDLSDTSSSMIQAIRQLPMLDPSDYE